MQVAAGRFIAAALSLVLVAENAPTEAAGAAAKSIRSSLRHVHVTVAAAVPPVRIPVTEPVRVKRPHPKPPTSRPAAAPAVRPSNPVAVAGPPMVRPRDLDAVIASARRRNLSPSESSKPNLHVSQPRLAPSIGTARGGVRRAQSLPSDPTASGTGINPWWRYQEQSLPGGGSRMMVNVGTGNLLVQQDDMSVPHKGIAMAFRRTYNSQMPATVQGTALTWTSLYGNGWTSTFDAHLIAMSATQWSVYDVDGARYDYVQQSDGSWLPSTAGVHESLVSDNSCGMLWRKKSGTMYYFWIPMPQPQCANSAAQFPVWGGLAGRVHQIIGRNRNTYITFGYAWDNGNASPTTGKMSSITATTESGMSATLSFADVNGRRLLQTLTEPDGTGVRYFYDANGNLGTVIRPLNNAAGNLSMLSFGYTTIGSDQILFNYSSPRWCGNTIGCGYDGAWVLFLFNGTSAATSTFAEYSYYATLNPTIADGTNTPLYPGYQPAGLNYSNLRTEYYTTGVATPTYRDTDGHMTNWVVDGLGRPTQTQECTASANQGQLCTGTLLLTNESWDVNNNLISEVDSRGNKTDYAYDANGNTVAVGQPQTSSSQGTFRPTSLYSYDAFNNVTAYCDPNVTHALSRDWVSTPSGDSLCPITSTLATRFIWSTDPTQSGIASANPLYEPNGQLIARIGPGTTAAPTGYRVNYTYDASRQSGTDFGLPTTVAAAVAIGQADGSSRLPAQNFWYDGNGNLGCYDKGNGAWVIRYDVLGRVMTTADPDDASANSGSVCAKSTGRAGWNTQTTYTYYPDGSKATSQSPSERGYGVSSQYTYDLDGNVVTETAHHGCTSSQSCNAGTTTKWYDGADRLVEVMLPQDPVDYYASPWITRYLYDISAGGTVSFMGTSFPAYGNLYKTEEVSNATISSGQNVSNILEIKGQQFDALDRLVTAYTFQNGAVRGASSVYDGTAATLGLLTSTTNQVGQVATYSYDELGRQHSVQFSNDGATTPDRTITYDPSGRTAMMQSVMLGTQSWTRELDGRITEVDEFTGGTQALSSPAQLKYTYYADGTRRTLSVASSALTADPLLSYAYRADGARTMLQATKGSVTSPFSWTYTDGGRVLTQNDPATGSVIPGATSPIPPGSRFMAKQYSYDVGGALAGVSLPVGVNFFQITRDPEGSITRYSSSIPPSGVCLAPTANTSTSTLNVTSRGEATSLSVQAPSPTCGATITGTAWSKNAANGYLADASGLVPWDPRYGVALAPGPTQIPDNCTLRPSPSSYYSYDNAGRRVGADLVQMDSETCTDSGYPSTTSYDAENHVASYMSGGQVARPFVGTRSLTWPLLRAILQRRPITMTVIRYSSFLTAVADATP